MRAAKRLGANQVAFAKARIAANNRKAPTPRPCSSAVPHELHSDPGYMFSNIQLLRREDKFAEAAQLMLSAPKDPGRLHNLDEWWIERRLLARKLLDIGENRTAYLIARDAALPARDIYKTEQEFTAGWIALRFLNDPATAAQHFARIGVGSVNPTALARAGYWQGRAAEAAGRLPGGARGLRRRAAEQSTSYYGQLARAKLGLPQIELHGAPAAGRGASSGWRSSARRSCSIALDERDLAIPILADLGENGDPDALAGLGELAVAHMATRAACCCSARPRSTADCRSISMPIRSVGMPPFKPIGPEVEPSIVYAIARQESAFNPRVVSPAQADGPDAGDAGCRHDMSARSHGATFDLAPAEDRSGLQCRTRRGRARRPARGLSRLLHPDLRGLQCRPRPRQEWIERYGDPRDPKVDRGRLGRTHPVLGDAQLRAADHGEPAGLSRPLRRRHASCRSRPTCSAAPASNSQGRDDLLSRSRDSVSKARSRASSTRPGVRSPRASWTRYGAAHRKAGH